jgi:hypothetical protein
MTSTDETVPQDADREDTLDNRSQAIVSAERLIDELKDAAEAMRHVPNDGDSFHIGRINAAVEAWDQSFGGVETDADRAIVVCMMLDCADPAKEQGTPAQEIAGYIVRHLPIPELVRIPVETWVDVLQRWDRGKWRGPGEAGQPTEGHTPWSHDIYSILVKAGLTNATGPKNMADAVHRKLRRNAAKEKEHQPNGKQ